MINIKSVLMIVYFITIMSENIPLLLNEAIHLVSENTFDSILQSWILRLEIAHRFAVYINQKWNHGNNVKLQTESSPRLAE